MRRPGFLGEHSKGLNGYLVPKTNRFGNWKARTYLGGFGAFGKGFIAPPPNAPPGMTPNPDAITPDGKMYMQDPRCPAGEKMGKVTTKCKGQECCDPSGCDPEGWAYTEDECVDDPNYIELPDEPPGGFKSCKQRAAARYPGPCDKKTCPTCFAPATPKADPSQMDTAQMQAELLRMQQEQAAASGIPPVSATYTGGGAIPTSGPIRSEPEELTAEDRVSQLVAEHEERKAMSSPAPTALYTAAPPSRVIQTSAPKEEGAGGITGLFAWLSAKLFGTPAASNTASDDELDGLGNITSGGSTKLLIGGLAIAALYYSYKRLKLNEPNLQKSTNRR